MNQTSLHPNEDEDSLFGSPPPSPVRGRSPSQEAFIAGGNTGPIAAAPGTRAGGKNVGTIALPGSHMSCAELPADLPASGLSLSRPISSHGLPSVTPPVIARTSVSIHTPVAASRSPTRSVSSGASSPASHIHILPASASIRKRRKPKTKTATPVPSAPPITLPGPDDPTPPNLLRSQSSLLGLAGLVGCVKPARLYTYGLQPAPIQPPSLQSPVCGSTPTHPIVLDDDQDTPRIGKHPHTQFQMPQNLDQLNPKLLRSNIISALTREKNIFPVLESLIKLLGGEPTIPSASLPSQSFARPYGHGIFHGQSTPMAPSSAPGDQSTLATTLTKRRKLKHVPAGASDWDVPFPFAAGEGPEAYRNTWAQDRAKQLVTQLLELVQSATKRAAFKTAKSAGNYSEGRVSTQNSQLSRSTSIETQTGQTGSTQASIPESSLSTTSGLEGTATGTPGNGTPVDTQVHFRGSSETFSTMMPSPKDRTSIELEGASSEAVSCDYSAFEEWLSQLVPPETNAPTPESDWITRSSVPFNSSASGSAPDIPAAMQHDILVASHAIQDEAIDPTLLAMSQQTGPTPPQSPTLPAPVLIHSPRTSLSSLTEPLTPLSDASVDLVPTSTVAHQDFLRGPPTPQSAEKDHHLQPLDRGLARVLPSSAEPSEPGIAVAQKGKGQTDVSVVSPRPSASGRSTSGVVSTMKGALDKQAILEHARERRTQLVAEIERAKVEIWETSIENAVLVHLMRDESS